MVSLVSGNAEAKHLSVLPSTRLKHSMYVIVCEIWMLLNKMHVILIKADKQSRLHTVIFLQSSGKKNHKHCNAQLQLKLKKTIVFGALMHPSWNV